MTTHSKAKHLTRRPVFGPMFDTDPLRDFDQLMAGFFRPVTTTGELDEWRPAADIRETEEAFLVEAELPGIAKDDVTVTFEDGVLSLSGERKFEEESGEGTLRRVERSYGSFTRSFRLPREVDAEAVTAAYADGVLTVTIPKTETAKPRTIEIS